MKKTTLRLRVALASLGLLLCLPAKADFNITFLTAGSSNPVFDVGGSVANTGSYLSGTAFKGQLYVGANAGSLAAVGTGGLTVSSATAGDNTGIRTFLTGGGAGFINGGTLTVSSGTLNVNSSAVYQFRVWEAAYSSYEVASATVGAKIGASEVRNITLGGTLAGDPPSVISATANTHGAFGLTTVVVPEPATIALGLFGAAGLLIRRRK